MTSRFQSRDSRCDWALVAFLVVLCFAEYCVLPGDGAQNPWLAMTGPWCPSAVNNPVLGYAWAAIDGDIVSNENQSLLLDQAMLAGKVQNRMFYALRPGVGFVAFLIFWLDSMAAAKSAVVSLGLLTVVATYAAARRCGSGRMMAAGIALSCWHLGALSFHLHDLSAHIGGLAGWMTASFAVLACRPWRASTSRSALLFIHTTMIVACLLYWNNVAVYLAFVLAQWPHWRRIGAGLAALAGTFGLRALWPAMINFVYWARTDYSEIERTYLQAAISGWRALHAVSHAGQQARTYLAEGILAEPATVILVTALVVALWARWRARQTGIRRFLRDRRVAFIVMSMVAASIQFLVWSPSASARGYLLYGVPAGMLLLLACANGPNARCGRGQPLLAAVMAVLLAFQVGWVAALSFDNPVPVCQFMSGYQSAANLPRAFVDGFRKPVRFVALDGDGEVQRIGEFAEVLRSAIADLRGSVAATQFAPMFGYRGASRSLGLCLLLFAPLVVAAVNGMRAFGRGASPLARPAVAMLMATYLWLASWWLSPQFKGAGLEMLPLAVPCEENGAELSYPLTLSARVLARLHALDVDRFAVVSGWQRSNQQTFRTRVLQVPSGTSLIAAADGTYSLGMLDQWMDRERGQVALSVDERFDARPTGYIGWQLAASRIPSAGCGSPLRPFVELRGYRRGDRAATVFAY